MLAANQPVCRPAHIVATRMTASHSQPAEYNPYNVPRVLSGHSHAGMESVYNIVTILRPAPVQWRCKVELLYTLIFNDDGYCNFTAWPERTAGSIRMSL